MFDGKLLLLQWQALSSRLWGFDKLGGVRTCVGAAFLPGEHWQGMAV